MRGQKSERVASLVVRLVQNASDEFVFNLAQSIGQSLLVVQQAQFPVRECALAIGFCYLVLEQSLSVATALSCAVGVGQSVEDD